MIRSCLVCRCTKHLPWTAVGNLRIEQLGAFYCINGIFVCSSLLGVKQPNESVCLRLLDAVKWRMCAREAGLRGCMPAWLPQAEKSFAHFSGLLSRPDEWIHITGAPREVWPRRPQPSECKVKQYYMEAKHWHAVPSKMKVLVISWSESASSEETGDRDRQVR